MLLPKLEGLRFSSMAQAHEAKVHLEQAHWKDQVRTISMAQEDSNDVLRGFKDLLTSTAQDQREFQANLLLFFFLINQANLHAYKEDKGLVDQSHQTTLLKTHETKVQDLFKLWRFKPKLFQYSKKEELLKMFSTPYIVETWESKEDARSSSKNLLDIQPCITSYYG